MVGVKTRITPANARIYQARRRDIAAQRAEDGIRAAIAERGITLPGAMSDRETSIQFSHWCARRLDKYDHSGKPYEAYAKMTAELTYGRTHDQAHADSVFAERIADYAAEAAAAISAASFFASARATKAAYDRERRQQADWIRKHVPFLLGNQS